jgi:hypothetical protein
MTGTLTVGGSRGLFVFAAKIQAFDDDGKARGGATQASVTPARVSERCPEL